MPKNQHVKKNRSRNRSNNQRKPSTILGRMVIWSLFVVYLFFVLYILLLKGTIDLSFLNNLLPKAPFQGVRNYNLKIFHTIRLFWNSYQQTGDLFSLLNLAGNILIFIPYGIFVPLLSQNRKTFWLTFLSGTCLILLIELLQLITMWGILDIDDYILNMLGILIGWLILTLFRSVTRKSKI